MTDRVPLIVDSQNQNVKELPVGDNLDLTGSNLVGVVDITASGNTSIGGTLGVTGGITATGGLSGAITSSNVTVTGGTIDGTTIGATTPSTGVFTSITGTAVTQSSTDTTDGRVLRIDGANGYFGLGGTVASGVDGNDLDNIERTGFYRADSTTVNRPGESGNWVGVHFARTADAGATLLINRSSGEMQVRPKTATEGFGPYRRHYDTGNISTIDATTNQIFRVDGNERMRITSAGNVGIGTTSPSSALTVQGAITGTAVTQGQTDTTGGRLMKVGDFGLAAISSPFATDLDDEIRSGWVGGFNIISAPTTGSFIVLTNSRNNIRKAQIAQFTSDGQIYARGFGDNGWREWFKYYNTGNILGTVGQSGGDPTGAIIERGSNSNGEFVRFADGTQICTYRNDEITIDYDTPRGSDWYIAFLGDKDFPAAFSQTPTFIGGFQDRSAAGFISFGSAPSPEAWRDIAAMAQRSASAVLADRRISLVAIGRWF